jgi:hypothetical protein
MEMLQERTILVSAEPPTQKKLPAMALLLMSLKVL